MKPKLVLIVSTLFSSCFSEDKYEDSRKGNIDPIIEAAREYIRIATKL